MNFSIVVDRLLAVGQPIVILLLALALFYFLFGVVKYMFKYGDEKARKESLQIMSYGIFALFVMVSVWGLVSLFASIIGESVGIPQL